MGMGSIHVSTPERRDRLWLLNAFAIALLTLLGAAGEALGYDRYLKSNTTARRTHSLFRQGCMLYELIPDNAGAALVPFDRTVRHDARRTPGLFRNFRDHLKMRGMLRLPKGLALTRFDVCSLHVTTPRGAAAGTLPF